MRYRPTSGLCCWAMLTLQLRSGKCMSVRCSAVPSTSPLLRSRNDRVQPNLSNSYDSYDSLLAKRIEAELC